MQRAGLVNKPGAGLVPRTSGQVNSNSPKRLGIAAAEPTLRRQAESQPRQQLLSTAGFLQDPSRIPAYPPESRNDRARPVARRPLKRLSTPQGRPLHVGSAQDPLEAEADRTVSAPVAEIKGKGGPQWGARAPQIVHEALTMPGHPLDAAARAHFETRFGQDFSSVRLHTGRKAERAARAVHARAFTVADHIVLGETSADTSLLAHELAHVIQQSAAAMPWVQRQQAGTQAKPRQDYVFIMGQDKKGTSNPFYKYASLYFHAHYPSATFVEDKRTLTDMLSWISSNVTDPIGNLYIVSHGAEDGTLAFGLDASGKDTTVIGLRDALHPSGGGSSSLPSVGSVIDAQTKIHIKGCDIGRTREMVELIDEAFGGAGTVTAPTHEQDYAKDDLLGEEARTTAHDKAMATFRAGLPQLPPAPAPVDRKLKGAARKKAQEDYDKAIAARKKAQADQTKAIAAEEKRIEPDLNAVQQKAETIDHISGPMFQRPGTKWFTAAELKPEIDRLYGQLSEAQRKSLAQRLVAPDHGGPQNQQGQKTIKITPNSESFMEPASLAEAKAGLAKPFQAQHFVADGMTTKRTPGSNGTDVEYTFTGKAHPPGADPFDTTATVTVTIPDDASIIAGGKAEVNNPGRYSWRVERKHTSSGETTLTAVGERVMAYLHHGSLDPKQHEYFSEPESNPDFYATSTFAPPPPPASSGASTKTP